MINAVVLNVSLFEGMASAMRVRNLIDPLIENGDILVSNLAITHVNEEGKIGQAGIRDKIRYLHIGYNSAFSLYELYTFWRSGFKFLREVFKSGNSNILYNYGYPDVKNIFFLLYARKIGYKIIFDVVEDNKLTQKFTGFLGRIKVKSSIILLNQIKNIGEAVIVISNHLKKRLESITKDEIPVFFIPITVNFKYFSDEPKPFNSSDLKIFYGGSFNPAKDGIVYLVNAFNEVCEHHKNISLILSGASSIKSEMDTVLEMIKSNDKIIYKGYLSTNDYYAVLNDADIFCMPRNNSPFAHAGFPFKLGEFLAAGKATIASDVGDVSNYLEDKKNALLVKPESQSEIRDAIMYCINNIKFMESIGKEARVTAHKFFDSEILSKELLTILEEI